MTHPGRTLDAKLADSLRRGGVLILRRSMGTADAEALTEQSLQQLAEDLASGGVPDEEHAIVHQFRLLIDSVRGSQVRLPVASHHELEAAGSVIRTVLSQLSDQDRTLLANYVGLSGKTECPSTRPSADDARARRLLSRIRARYLQSRLPDLLSNDRRATG